MPRHTPITDSTKLRTRLDQLVATFDLSHLEPDPLQLVRAYDEPLDQEVVGLIAAAFAYGRADIVVANIGRVLGQMGPSPYRYLTEEFGPAEARRRFRGFAHRFHKTPELVALLDHLAHTLREHGSLGTLFSLCYDENDPDIGPALSRFVGQIIAMRPAAPRTRAALQYMLTSPNDGSACKR